jgi:stage V sporulation protein B
MATLASIFMGAIIYFIVLLLNGGITKQELELIPGGSRITPTLSKLGLLRRRRK